MKSIFIVVLSPKWTGIARLPQALKNEGFTVLTLSAVDSYLSKSKFIDFNYTYRSIWEFRRKIKEIVKRHQVDFIIPGCDAAISYFGQVLGKSGWRKESKLRRVILQSCNIENAFDLLGNKSSLQNLAVKHHILTPDNKHVNSLNELTKEIENRKFPVVLKKDFGVAGKGVKICQNPDEIKLALKNLNCESFNTTWKYRVTSLINSLLSKPYVSQGKGISVQNYIEGTACMHLVFASKGLVLSSVTLLKINCYPGQTGPSSVVKPIIHKQISAGSEKIIKESNVTGFYSFDYIIDNKGDAYMLECNPRPTPVTHLSHLLGGNLCAAMKKHLENNIVCETHQHSKEVYEYISLFPNELKRDCHSSYLSKGYHDIPYDDPLLLEMINEDLKSSGIEPVKNIKKP